MSWLHKRHSRWEGVDFLALKLKRCVDHEKDTENGQVVLLVPRFRTGLLARWLQPRLQPARAHIRVKLDERGSWIWRQCDEGRTVAEIATGFVASFPQERDQIEHRICQFIYYLQENGFIRFTTFPPRESSQQSPRRVGDKA